MIRERFARFEESLKDTFKSKELLFDVSVDALDVKPEQFASNYMESCLFDIMKACTFCTEGMPYRDAVLQCVPRYFEGGEFAQFVATVNPLHFTLWVSVMMYKMDDGRHGYDADFIELVCRYILRDQIHMKVFGQPIGNSAREWPKMIQGPNRSRYGGCLKGWYED